MIVRIKFVNSVYLNGEECLTAKAEDGFIILPHPQGYVITKRGGWTKAMGSVSPVQVVVPMTNVQWSIEELPAPRVKAPEPKATEAKTTDSK